MNHAIQRADLLADDLSIPVQDMDGKEYYLQLKEPVLYEQLEHEQDDEYNARLYLPSGMVKCISIDLDFIE